MSEFISAGLLVAGIAVVCIVAGFGGWAYMEGLGDGEFDLDRPAERKRPNDRFNGWRRALYEIGYVNGEAGELRVRARRAEREGRES